MIAPLLVIALFLAGWQALVRLQGIDPIVLPAPTEVASALWRDRDLLLTATSHTLIVIGAGLLGGARARAAVRHRSAPLTVGARAIEPLLVGSQAVPVPILAPLLVVWLGFGLLPQLVLVVVIAFFPLAVATRDALAGLSRRPISCCATSAPRRANVCASLSCRARGRASSPAHGSPWSSRVIGAVFADATGQSATTAADPTAAGGLGRIVADAVLNFRRIARSPRSPCSSRCRWRSSGRSVASNAAWIGDHPATPRRPHEPHAPPRPKLLLALVGALVTTGLLAGCGEKSEDETAVTGRERVTLVLDYFPKRRPCRDLRRAGPRGVRACWPRRADPGAGRCVDAAEDARGGKADFVITYQPELVLARAEGQKVQALAALVQEPLTSLISLPRSPVREASDLKGKTRRHRRPELSGRVPRHDPEGRRGGSEVGEARRSRFNLTQPLIAKRVDVSLGAFWNYEGVELARKKKDPVITKITDLGVPKYHELLVAASEDTVRSRGPVVRRFIQALGIGANKLKADPNAGLDPLLEASPGLDRGLRRPSSRRPSR